MSRGKLASQWAGVGGDALGYAGTRSGWLSPGPGMRRWLRSGIRLWSAHWMLGIFALLGVWAAAVVGYLVAQNPQASPAHVAVGLRVAIIVTLVATGTYAQLSTRQTRVGLLLVAAGLFSAVWLLNGSREPALFSIGRLCAGLAPIMFAYLLLAYPSGRLRSSAQRRLLLGAAGAMLVLWTFIVLTTAQPPMRTPLVACAPSCPANALFIGSAGSGAVSVAKAGVSLIWALVACGTPVLLSAGLRTGAEPLRRSFVPLELAAVVNACFWLGYVATDVAGSRANSALGAAYIETAVLVPIAIVAGLFVERLSMGRALATFVRRLAERPEAPPDVLLASALKDPTIEISYYEPQTAMHADRVGRRGAARGHEEHRAIALIERNGAPLAAITYDAALSDQAAFVEAAGAVAVMQMQANRLQADLTHSNQELAASRLRLVEAADAERQRIERDLHDGVQQHILGLRLRLDRAADAIRTDPARGAQMIGTIGLQVDDLLSALRSLAAGIYPSMLTQRGLKDALESVVRNAPRVVHLHTFGLRRYPEDVEVAIYFCCLEAIQNIVKHAGPGADANMRVWQVGTALAFDIRDTGEGFDPAETPAGSGLVNMRDRIEAVGGRLWVSSQKGRGTWVRGRIPLG